MLVKTFIITVVAFVGLTHAVREPWERNLEVSAFGSSFYLNFTGVTDSDETGLFGGNSETTSAPTSTPATTPDCHKIPSRACQNFAEARQNAINNQINEELAASYAYLAMGTYFSRDDPNKKGFADFFFKASAEEREHAIKLIEYQNERGGRVTFTQIQAPENTSRLTGLEAMEEALRLEKSVNLNLLKLHALADEDPHMQDFLETHYLTEQVDSIRELSGYISQLQQLQTTGLGEFIFDGRLQDKK